MGRMLEGLSCSLTHLEITLFVREDAIVPRRHQLPKNHLFLKESSKVVEKRDHPQDHTASISHNAQEGRGCIRPREDSRIRREQAWP